jgi:serine/threonine protein kinase|mmetsp:Transcript_73937/g.116736  ORF Transcript_73937/g.116736 Transcript_73937/m.116736 type:complete len:919 (+) Transcript_73937:106-2862(+)
MVVCHQEIDSVPVGSLTTLAFKDTFYKPAMSLRGNELTARLNSLHCVNGSFAPLQAPLDAKAVWASQGPRILITIEAEAECLVGYRSPSLPDKRLGASNDVPDFRCNAGKMEVAIRLPLQFAAARTIGREFVQDRNVLALILPELDVVPTALRPDSQPLIPKSADGVWMLDCDTADELQKLADVLQRAGCAMQGFEDRYELGELLGVGSFSKVLWAEDRRTGLPVAAKIVPKGGVAKDKLLMKEVCVLRQASHPSVLEFRGFFEAVDPEEQSGVWVIVTEFVGGGELFERVRQHGRFEEDRAAYIAYQLLSALKILHERRIVHRDIKTENVILVENTMDEIKLVDFGLATPESDREAMSVRCGSPGYIAPEVLRNEKYGCKVDCFSVGVLLHILLVGRGPFRGKSTEEMLARNLKCKVSPRPLSHVSSPAKELLLSLLDPDPENRPTAAEALEHPWLHQHIAARNPSLLKIDDRVDTKVTSASTCADSQDARKASEQSFHSLFVEHGPRSSADMSAGFGSDVLSPRTTRREQSMSAFFTTMADTDLPNETNNEENIAKNDDDADEDDPCPNMPLLRTSTPVWADVQRSLSNLRLKGLSPRQTLESYRKSRNSWNDGRMSGRHTGRLTRDLFDMERTSTFFTKEAEERPRNSFPEDKVEAPGILRELAESDVRKNGDEQRCANKASAPDEKSKMTNTPWHQDQDVLTELKTETGVAETHKGCMIRRRCGSKQPSSNPSMDDSCASGTATSAVRSLRHMRSMEANRDVDLMLESSCEFMKPQPPGSKDSGVPRIRSLRGRNPITGPEPLTDLDGSGARSRTTSSQRQGTKPLQTPVTPSTPSDCPDGKRHIRPARAYKSSSSQGSEANKEEIMKQSSTNDEAREENAEEDKKQENALEDEKGKDDATDIKTEEKYNIDSQ